jgi:lysophospholipase
MLWKAAMTDTGILDRSNTLDVPLRLIEPLPAFGRLETPDGGFLRHARWEPPGGARATLVLLNGRSEFIEKHDELAHGWLDRGYRVFALDWRSQGLSSRFLPNRQKGHVPDFRLMVEDLGRFMDQVVLPGQTGPLVLFAHSMGGHIAAHYLEMRAGLFAAAILSAPMGDFHTRNIPRWVVQNSAAIMSTVGFAGEYAAGEHDYDPADHRFETNPVTHDPARWAVHHRWYRANPDLILGGVTWGWLAAAFASIERLNAVLVSAAGDLPVLVLAPGKEGLVPPEAQEALARRYRNGRLARYADARHEVMMEIDPIRNGAWADIDGFLTGTRAV